MNVLSLLDPRELEQLGGLTPKMICGTFEGDDTDPQHFIENKEFVDLVHKTIAEKGIKLPSLIDLARRRVNGYVYIIDLRTPQGVIGNVPKEDIIGAFKVEDTWLVKNSYWRNESHKIYTKNGLVTLPPDLRKLIIDELKK